MNDTPSTMPPSMDTPERNHSVDGHGSNGGGVAADTLDPTNNSTVMNTTNTNLIASSAADLIRQLDAACSEMTMQAVAGARDAESARSNARVASELARRFAPGAKDGTWMAATVTTDHNATKNELATSYSEDEAPMRPPPAPSMSHWKENASPYHNGSPVTPTNYTNSEQPQDNDSSTAAPYLSTARQQRLNKHAERLAQSHTEDLLQVSLELERTKQQLEHEQMSHDETKAALGVATQKTAQLETHMETLLSDMETARESHGRQLDALQEELACATDRIEAADADAALATDLTMAKHAEWKEAEHWLLEALQEMERYKQLYADVMPAYGGEESPSPTQQSQQQIVACGIDNEESKSVDVSTVRHVRWENDQGPSDPPTDASLNRQNQHHSQHNRPNRALVAAGRQVLERSYTSDDNSNNESRSTPFRVSLAASAERRQMLLDRLSSNSAEKDTLSGLEAPSTSHSSHQQQHQRNQLGSAVQALDLCRKTAGILKECGARLNLSGRWFSGPATAADEIHLETLARHFTSLVEVQMDRKHKEITELESLVSLWEHQQGRQHGPHHNSKNNNCDAAAVADEKSSC